MTTPEPKIRTKWYQKDIPCSKVADKVVEYIKIKSEDIKDININKSDLQDIIINVQKFCNPTESEKKYLDKLITTVLTILGLRGQVKDRNKVIQDLKEGIEKSKKKCDEDMKKQLKISENQKAELKKVDLAMKQQKGEFDRQSNEYRAIRKDYEERIKMYEDEIVRNKDEIERNKAEISSLQDLIQQNAPSKDISNMEKICDTYIQENSQLTKRINELQIQIQKAKTLPPLPSKV